MSIDVARWVGDSVLRYAPRGISNEVAIRAAYTYSMFTSEVFWLYLRDKPHAQLLISPYLQLETAIRNYGP